MSNPLADYFNGAADAAGKLAIAFATSTLQVLTEHEPNIDGYNELECSCGLWVGYKETWPEHLHRQIFG